MVYNMQIEQWSLQENYSVGEWEDPPVIFALKRYRYYLFSTKSFTIITEHQALRSVFKGKDVCGRLGRCLELLAEELFKMINQSSISNQPADYLSRQPPPKTISSDIVQTMDDPDNRSYEHELLAMTRFLRNIETKDLPFNVKSWVGKDSENFTFWEEHMFSCTAYRLRPIAPIKLGTLILKQTHYDIGYWDAETTKQFILDLYRWSMCQKDIDKYVKNCDVYQIRNRFLNTAWRCTYRFQTFWTHFQSFFWLIFYSANWKQVFLGNRKKT